MLTSAKVLYLRTSALVKLVSYEAESSAYVAFRNSVASSSPFGVPNYLDTVPLHRSRSDLNS